MKTTRIKIKNLFGISEKELDGQSIELRGTNGTGKTSVIDAIKYALTNSSERDYIIKNGENEGEIIVETDTGLRINRKKRSGQADYKSIKENGKEVSAPESFLSQLFTPLQLDPVAFTLMDKKEQNRRILDLIEYPWDLNWIKEQFGEIPSWVNYEQNILQVLFDIQDKNGDYFKQREDVNRDIRNNRAFISDIAKDIPPEYDFEKWDRYDIGAKYRELEEIRKRNSVIERAKSFKEHYEDKLRGLQAKREIAVSEAEKSINDERTALLQKIERLNAEINAAKDSLNALDEKRLDKIKVCEAEYNEALAKLDSDVQIANKYADSDPEDTAELEDEIQTAETMRKHLNEYGRMMNYRKKLDELTTISEEYTRKIELARTLPGKILETATIPIEGLSVKDGVPHVNGLPVSNLSEGEKLNLCVDVALSKPNALQIILIDGVEKLSDENRNKLYAKCKEKGLQFIATRTTNDSEMEVIYL